MAAVLSVPGGQGAAGAADGAGELVLSVQGSGGGIKLAPFISETTQKNLRRVS